METDGVARVRITILSGTTLRLSIAGRRFFTDTKITNEKWSNLPTGEVLVDGRAIQVDSVVAHVVEKVNVALATDAMDSIVGEKAIGWNPKARIVTESLDTEKTHGTAHVAFGRNIDYPTGGRNDSANHMDFIIGEPTVTAGYADGREWTILDEGTVSV